MGLGDLFGLFAGPNTGAAWAHWFARQGLIDASGPVHVNGAVGFACCILLGSSALGRYYSRDVHVAALDHPRPLVFRSSDWGRGGVLSSTAIVGRGNLQSCLYAYHASCQNRQTGTFCTRFLHGTYKSSFYATANNPQLRILLGCARVQPHRRPNAS